MPQQTNRAIKCIKDGRLAYYLAEADASFWDRHWQPDLLTRDEYRWAEKGALGWFEKPFIRHLPRNGRIIEAGCGQGQIVMALRVRGYDVEGVEWAANTVDAVHTLYNDLPIRAGDVTCLDVPDGYYNGYISLGVMEHNIDGPEPYLAEAFRVLSRDGIACISVPNFHGLRKIKARFGLYKEPIDGMDFYQYAFTDHDFTEILWKAGFIVIDRYPYDGLKGIKDEISIIHQALKWKLISTRLESFLRSWKWADRHYGHMNLFVCHKKRSYMVH